MSKVDANKVYDYLLQNYPPKVLKWVKGEKWSYDDAVPLRNVEMDRRPGGRDPKKVAGISRAIESGQPMEPVVLVQTKDGLKIADGYHRTLAFRHAGKKTIHAYVALGDHDEGPWDREMHDAKMNTSDKEVRPTQNSHVQSQMSVEQRLDRAERLLAVFAAEKIMSEEPNPGGRRKKGYPEERKEYADPQDRAYPLDTLEHVKAAARYFAKYRHKYSEEKQAEIKRRIDEAEKKHGIGKYHKEDAAHSAPEGLADVLDILKHAFTDESTESANGLAPDEVDTLKFIAKAFQSEQNERTNPQHSLAEAMTDSFFAELNPGNRGI